RLCLRYDLTVPFSRFVGMNPNLKVPFKKYLMGEVFRDGPIKTGRYREFMQMDPDIYGTESVLADAEIIAVTSTVFANLGLPCVIEFNNRKLIDGLLEQVGIPEEKHFEVVVSIDKLKKLGEAGVTDELREKGLTQKQIASLITTFTPSKDNSATLKRLKKSITSPTGKEGLKEIEDILHYLKLFGVTNAVFLPSLARGLAYYTGPVYEAYLTDSSITSSAAGGG
ncbi:histidine--tRNA ligase, partial [Candidatus Woesearchaeota archaeon CG_4_10_14_0_8_um_filter_47_5]